MDAKDLRAESALAERSNDGGAKFAHSAAVLHYDRNKSCQEIGSFKVDAQGARPCAVIGPDRVAPPARDSFPKKAPVEPWLSPDPGYRRPPDYPHKMAEYQDPTRNISPRQTFQENMQRIIMPPGYNAVKLNEETAYASKNNKINVPLERKYCDVPYNVNPISSDQKNIRNAEHSVSNVNPLLVRGVPHGWPTGSVNVRPLRPYGADVYQYPDYASCTGARPAFTRPQASGHEEPSQLYPDPYYHEGNMRFKPYPNIKERYPQTRYEYLSNYPNPYHPPHPFTAHKYELPKTMPAHPYPAYAQVPLKYSERVSEPVLDGYQRPFNQQGNYGVPFRNPVIQPPYRPLPGNPLQNKLHPYPIQSDGPNKTVSNKLPYDPNSKIYVDYENPRTKAYPVGDNYYLNDVPRPYHAKNQIILPNYPSSNMHGVNPHPYIQLKNYEYARLKGMDPSIMNNPLTKLPMQFSPSTLAISPADSNASNETAQTHGTSQEDCGYVSQSSITSVRSVESLNRMPMDMYGRYDYRYGPFIRTSPLSKPDSNNQSSKSKKDIRQFISSWSEGDDDNVENSSKRDAKMNSPKIQSFTKQFDHANNQEQLYVLGSVNVPSEELSKYEHIQKVSKLPENIKGYNSLELLNQFEEVIESTNINIPKLPLQREVQVPLNHVGHKQDTLPRAVSPLDVEAKISQSVIHKDVGCNFEIKPCSPKMLNVQVAAPVQTILNERVIEKVANPLNTKSPMVLQSAEDNMDTILNNRSIKYPLINTASSCKMINSQLISESSPIDHLKTNYSLQDLESNSGVCLASLPRLDNDIELNFPEVNQQFINANKTESVITTSYPKDLPTLGIERSESNNLRNNVSSAEFEINCHFSPKSKTDTENDFSRLSKYRKLKRNTPGDNNETQAKAQATRVDSVIIKNPDNARIHEETNDASRSGGYLKKDSQEFAINLACQTKNSQALRQNELDSHKNIQNIHEKSGKYSPSEFITHSKSVNLLNKGFNVVEASHHNEVDMQSEDLSMSYKDLSNRYLEKAALDMPMNLSPQGRYSINGADEDNRLGKENRDKIKHKNIEVKNVAQEEPKTNEHLNTTSFSDIIVTAKSDQNSISVECSTVNMVKECGDTAINKLRSTDEKFPNVLNVDKPNNSTNELVDGSKADEMSFNMNSEIDSARKFVNIVKEIDAGTVSTERPCKQQYQKIGEDCEDMLYVPKLKRTKNRTDIPRRKRSTESGSANTVDGNIKANNKKHKPRLTNNSHSEDPVSKPLINIPQIVSTNVVTDEIAQCGALNEMKWVDAEGTKMNLNSEHNSTNLITQFSEMTQNKHKLDLNQIKRSVTSIQNADIMNDIKVPDSVTVLHLENQSIKSNSTTGAFSKKAIPSKLDTCQSIENNLLDNGREIETLDNNKMFRKELSRETEVKNEDHEHEFEKCAVSKEDTIIKPCPPIVRLLSRKISDSGDGSKAALIFKNIFCKELFSPRFQNLIYEPFENNYSKTNEIYAQPTLHKQDTCSIVDEFKQHDVYEVDAEPNIANKDENQVDRNDAKSLNNYLEHNGIEHTPITNTSHEHINTYFDDLSVENCILSNIPHETSEDIELKEPYNSSEEPQTCNEKEVPFDKLKSNAIRKITEGSEDSEKPTLSCTQIPNEEKASNESDKKSFQRCLAVKDDGETFANEDEKNTNEVQELCDQEIRKIYSPDVNPDYSDTNENTLHQNVCDKPLYSLKRSLSDSALNAYNNDADKCLEKRYIMFPKKRQKCYNSSNIDESHLLNIIQNSRRNSISTVCNESNISFCILIDDNCIIEEEHYEQEENNVTETQDGALNDAYKDSMSQEEQNTSLTNNNLVEENCSDINTANDDKVKSWVEDVVYEEIIETEDIAENIVIGGPNSPKYTDSSDYESEDGDTGILNSAAVDHTNKVKHIYGDNMCTDDAQLVDALYRTPQMDVNKKLMDRESQITEKAAKYYDSDSLEMLLAEPISNYQHVAPESDAELKKSTYEPSNQHSDNKEYVKVCSQDSSSQLINYNSFTNVSLNDAQNSDFSRDITHLKVNNKAYNSTVYSCESSLDNVFTYEQQEDSSYTSSSPEVSSTTSEEKCSTIPNHKQTKTLEVNNLNFEKHAENSCKFTEKEYLNPDNNNSLSGNRPLITKGAQKYIPPLRESIPDLKVKLTLPQQSLLKLKNNKLSKEEPKLSTSNTYYNNNVNLKKEITKKVRPKFEDVLKNIDEVQIQKHKEKNKKSRKFIPKVVIKKNGNGSHYASTSSKASFNPDLTGRKWQPWVFIEKNQFIDKMALRNKTRAVFSHRKKTFVLNEKFYKYKSISSAKFIISQPKLDEYSTGNLKYTIKLKHGY